MMLGRPMLCDSPGNLVMFNYRLRMSPVKRPFASKGLIEFVGSFLSDWRDRVHLHTEIIFWKFEQVLLSKCSHCCDFAAVQPCQQVFVLSVMGCM